jgi:hypothetical protein
MGFTNGAHSGQIEHFLPGYIESYALDLHGQVTLDERIQFHKIDGTPVYKSVVEIKGNCLSYINFFFLVNVYLLLNIYYWVDTSAGGLLVPESIIHPVVRLSALT